MILSQLMGMMQRKIQLETKLTIYKTCVIAVLLYGAETWTLQSNDWRRLDAFHHWCQWHIFQLKSYDHVSNQEVISRTGLSSIGDIISCHRLGLFGHMVWLWLDSGVPLQMPSSVLTHHAEIRPPSGWRRRPGRPRQTWLHQIVDGSICQEWELAVGCGHSRQTRSSLRASAPNCSDDDDDDDACCDRQHYVIRMHPER